MFFMKSNLIPQGISVNFFMKYKMNPLQHASTTHLIDLSGINLLDVNGPLFPFQKVRHNSRIKLWLGCM